MVNEVEKKLRKGFIASFITKYSDFLSQFIIGAVLARHIMPSEFGIFSIIFIFINFSQLLSDIGVSAAVIQNRSLDREDIGSIFVLTIVEGAVLFTLFYIFCYYISNFYNNSFFTDARWQISVIILLNSLSTVPLALLRRQLKFKTVGWLTCGANLVSGIVGIILALNSFGVYSLIYKSIISSSIIFAIAFVITVNRYKFTFRISSIKKIAMYSINQFGFNVINYFSRNADNLLIGKFINETQLGIYDRAYKLMFYPIQLITYVIGPVLHPVLAEIQNDRKKILDTYLKVLELLSVISIPMIAFMFVFSKEIIFIVYGESWVEAVPVFRILCIASGFQVISSTTGFVFQAVGRTDLLFKVGLLTSSVILAGIVLGLKWGILGVSVCYVIAYLIIIIPLFHILLTYLGSNIKELFIRIRKSLLIGLFLLIFLSFATSMVRINNIYVNFLFFSLIGLLLYLALLKLLKLDRVIRKALQKQEQV